MATNAAQVQQYLANMHYPTTRQGLIDHALSMGADDDVIETLQQMRGDQFNSAADVSRELG